jgi:hypothetical protein
MFSFRSTSYSQDDDARVAWDRGSGRCWHCGRLLRADLYGQARPAGWVVEQHRKGQLGLRLVCWGCNELKGDLSDDAWKAILANRYPGRSPSWRNRRLIRRH